MGKSRFKHPLDAINVLAEGEHGTRRRNIAIQVKILKQLGVRNLWESMDETRIIREEIKFENRSKGSRKIHDKIKQVWVASLARAADERAARQIAKRGRQQGLGFHKVRTKAQRDEAIRRCVMWMEPGQWYWYGEIRARFGIQGLELYSHWPARRPPRTWFENEGGERFRLSLVGIAAREVFGMLE